MEKFLNPSRKSLLVAYCITILCLILELVGIIKTRNMDVVTFENFFGNPEPFMWAVVLFFVAIICTISSFISIIWTIISLEPIKEHYGRNNHYSNSITLPMHWSIIVSTIGLFVTFFVSFYYAITFAPVVFSIFILIGVIIGVISIFANN